jgi:hypothetical protein
MAQPLQPLQPLNLAPLFEALAMVAGLAAPAPLVIPPLHPAVAAAFEAAAADELDYDASTVPVDIDEYYAMAEVFADDLPGTVVNAIQEARPALALVRARDDVSNTTKNRFYYAIKRVLFLFLGNPENIDGWRNVYEHEVGEVLPHLPAAVIGDLAAPLEAFREAFQPAVDEMLGLRQADGSYVDHPDLYTDLYIYVRRMLRPEGEPPFLDEDAWLDEAPHENGQLDEQVPPPPAAHPALLPNGGGVLEEPHNEDNEEPP